MTRALPYVAAWLVALAPMSRAQPPAPAVDRYGEPLPAGAIARMGSNRMQPKGVEVVAFSTDKRWLAILDSQAHRLQVFDTRSGKELPHLDNWQSLSLQLAFLPNSTTLFVHRHQDVVRQLDIITGKEVGSLPVIPNVVTTSFALAPGGKMLALEQRIVGEVHRLMLWDLAKNKEVQVLLGLSGASKSLLFSADGTRLLASEVASVNEDNKNVTWARISTWEVAGGKLLHQRKFRTTYAVVSPSGKMAAWAGDKRIMLSDLDSGNEAGQIAGEYQSFAFSADGQLLATAGRNDKVILWQVATAKVQRVFADSAGTGDKILGFSADGTRLATTAQYHFYNWGHSSALRVWDVGSGREIRPVGGHSQLVAHVAFTPDSKSLVTGSRDQTVRLWDAGTGEERRTWDRFAAGLAVVAVSPSGVKIAGGDGLGTIKVWERTSGKLEQTLEGPALLACLGWTRDGKSLVAAGRGGQVCVWRDGAKTEHQLLPEGTKVQPTAVIALSPDARLVALTSTDRFGEEPAAHFRIWQADSGRLVTSLDLAERTDKDDRFAHTICWAAAFSPDGKYIATSQSLETWAIRMVLSKHRLRLWEIASGKEVAAWNNLPSAPGLLEISPEGRRLAYAFGEGGPWGRRMGDRSAVLVDTITRMEVGRLDNAGWLQAFAFSPDGKRLATAASDHTALVWNLKRLDRFVGPPQLLPDAVIPRQLTAQEVDDCWVDLARADGALAYSELAQLVLGGERVVPFLRDKLRPAPPVDLKLIDQWIRELDGAQFPVRNKAMAELEKVGALAESRLHKAKEARISLEFRRRLDLLIQRIERANLTPQELQVLRALTVLERTGSPPARALLETLARGAEEARLTQHARQALERLPR